MVREDGILTHCVMPEETPTLRCVPERYTGEEEMITEENVAEVVASGAALLDSVRDADWRDRIDVGILDMAHASRCVLGQLYGSWWQAPTDLRHQTAFTGKDGGTNRWHYEPMCSREEWDLLTKAWANYLAPVTV